MQALERAVELVGGQSALAEKIGKKQAHVAMWFKRRKVPAEVCADIEGATDGAVTCHDLRPDVFRAAAKQSCSGKVSAAASTSTEEAAR